AHAGLVVRVRAGTVREALEGVLVRPLLDHHPLLRMLAVAVHPNVRAAGARDVSAPLAQKVDEVFPVFAAGPEHHHHVGPPPASELTAGRGPAPSRALPEGSGSDGHLSGRQLRPDLVARLLDDPQLRLRLLDGPRLEAAV